MPKLIIVVNIEENDNTEIVIDNETIVNAIKQDDFVLLGKLHMKYIDRLLAYEPTRTLLQIAEEARHEIGSIYRNETQIAWIQDLQKLMSPE